MSATATRPARSSRSRRAAAPPRSSPTRCPSRRRSPSTTPSVYFGTSNGQVWKVAKGGKATPQRLDADTSVVTDVAVDDTDVYWISNFGPNIKVYKMPKNGGARAELGAFEGENARLVLIGGTLFASFEADRKVEVMKMLVDGSQKPKSVGGARGDSGGIGVDATHVFIGVADPKGDDGWIVRLPR